jgi:ABC-2 type transport system permease protein
MKKFWILIKQHTQLRLAYRGDMIVYSLASASLPLLGLALWLTTSNFTNLPYSQSELIAYFIVAIYVSIFTEMWQSWYMNESINNGSFSVYLIRPLGVIERFITELFSDKFYKMLSVSLLIPLAYFLVPKEVWGELSLNLIAISLFMVSVVFGFFILFLIELLIGLSTVWFYDIDFLKSYIDLANGFLAGRFVPLIFLPPILSNLAIFLPFRYAISFPIEILLNKLTFNAIILGFAVELFWLISMFVVYKIVFNAFVRNYKGYGA